MSSSRFPSLMLAIILLTILDANLFAQRSTNQVSKVWVADNGDGTYQNPIIHADYSDPDVIRVGDDYYLVASSFNAVPGLPILHSRDLVNWRIIGHVLRLGSSQSAPARRAKLDTLILIGSG